MEEHKPFIAPEQNIPELTLTAVLMGVVLGIVFGASSLTRRGHILMSRPLRVEFPVDSDDTYGVHRKGMVTAYQRG